MRIPFDPFTAASTVGSGDIESVSLPASSLPLASRPRLESPGPGDPAGAFRTLILAAGQASAVVLFTAAEDTQNEGAETLAVELLTPSTAAGTVQRGAAAARTASATLADNDPVVLTLVTPDLARAEGRSFPLRLAVSGTAAPSPAGAAVRVSYEISGSGITADDFGTLPGDPDPGPTPPPPLRRTVEFPVAEVNRALGDPSARLAIDLPSRADTQREADEVATFRLVAVGISGGGVELAAPSAQQATPTSAELTLRQLTVSIERTPGDSEFQEGEAGAGGQASFTLRVAGGAPIGAVTVPYAVTGVSASDVGPPGLRGSVTLPADADSAILLVRAADDALVEGRRDRHRDPGGPDPDGADAGPAR